MWELRSQQAHLRVAGADVDAGEVELYALEVGGRPRRLHIGELVALHDVAAQACRRNAPKSAVRQPPPAAAASARVQSPPEVAQGCDIGHYHCGVFRAVLTVQQLRNGGHHARLVRALREAALPAVRCRRSVPSERASSVPLPSAAYCLIYNDVQMLQAATGPVRHAWTSRTAVWGTAAARSLDSAAAASAAAAAPGSATTRGCAPAAQ